MAVTDEFTEKELRRLSRRDLLTLMVDMAKRTDELERTLELEREQHKLELERVKAAAESSRQAGIRAEQRLERLIDRLERGYAASGYAAKNKTGVVRKLVSELRSFFKKGN